MNTIVEVESAIFSYFNKNNIFDIDKNVVDIFTISENIDRAKAMALIALEELEKMGMLKKISYSVGKKEVNEWVLVKPMDQYSQTVEIKAATIQALSTTINLYCESTRDAENLVDPTNIKERDIQNLIILCQQKAMNAADE